MLFPEEEQEEGLPEWLATFADLSLLLLVFFILLYSMSTIEVKKFSNTFSSIRNAFGGKGEIQGKNTVTEEEGIVLETFRLQRQLLKMQEQTFTQIRTYLTQNGLEGKIGAVFDKGVITLRIPSEYLFKSGSTTLNDNAKEILEPLFSLFTKRKEQYINVRGFTDNTKVKAGAPYKDNWELSSLRAVNVVRYLINNGIPARRISATGFGESNPLYPNSSEENKAKNRRVEFILERRVM